MQLLVENTNSLRPYMTTPSLVCGVSASPQFWRVGGWALKRVFFYKTMATYPVLECLIAPLGDQILQVEDEASRRRCEIESYPMRKISKIALIFLKMFFLRQISRDRLIVTRFKDVGRQSALQYLQRIFDIHGKKEKASRELKMKQVFPGMTNYTSPPGIMDEPYDPNCFNTYCAGWLLGGEGLIILC